MLTNDFIDLCKEFAKNRQDVLCEKIEDSKKFCKYSIEFYRYILEFRYVKKESVFFKPSSLYCVLFLKKHSVVYYHLTDILPFLEQKSFKGCYFLNIESAEKLHFCFESLLSIIDLVTFQLEQFLIDDTLLLNHLFETYKFIYNLKDGDIDFEKIDDETNYSHIFFQNLQHTRDGYLFSRFSNFKPYSLLIKNKSIKAIENYEKLDSKGKLLEYEKQLLNYIKNSNKDFSLFDSTCNTDSNSRKFMAFFSFAKAFALIFAIASVIFCGTIAIYNLLLSHRTVILLSAPWYIGFLCAVLCALFGAFALFQYMPNKKLTKEERKNLSKVFLPKGEKIFSMVSFIASIIVSVLFAILFMSENVEFYEDKMKIQSQTYNYSQIDSIYYIESRYNDYGDRNKRASYVILFDDKTSLDLDGYTSVEYTKKQILPFFEKKGIQIKAADSEKQLPWYKDTTTKTVDI